MFKTAIKAASALAVACALAACSSTGPQGFETATTEQIRDCQAKTDPRMRSICLADEKANN